MYPTFIDRILFSWRRDEHDGPQNTYGGFGLDYLLDRLAVENRPRPAGMHDGIRARLSRKALGRVNESAACAATQGGAAATGPRMAAPLKALA